MMSSSSFLRSSQGRAPLQNRTRFSGNVVRPQMALSRMTHDLERARFRPCRTAEGVDYQLVRHGLIANPRGCNICFARHSTMDELFLPSNASRRYHTGVRGRVSNKNCPLNYQLSIYLARSGIVK